MKQKYSCWLGIIFFLLASCNKGQAPQPYGPQPSAGQLQWHNLETYAFVHFNMNTFTQREWGMGDEDPAWFNPVKLDCRQWVRVFKDTGFKGVILTAKHHDGFCLWPTATTSHSVKSSPWKNGEGDVVKELSEACREAGLKFGVYLSPWDRNNAHYGKPEYLSVFRAQLSELLTQYGDIFEVWFDGANGGSGYYGGANETRSVDRKNYYDWPATIELVRKLQPSAVIFSDAGPDVRWVGNESGFAGETNWALLRRDEFWPGCPYYRQLTEGHEDGTHWLPAEVDVSIRPGWYYHPSEDNKLKTLPELLDIYYHSVGRNASMLLNVPATSEGLIAEPDIQLLKDFHQRLEKELAYDLTQQASVHSDKDRGRNFEASKTTDNDPDTYWGTPDSISQGTLTFTFPEAVTINRILLQEPIALGQRIQKFSIEAWIGNKWEKITDATTVGYKRLLRTSDFTTRQVRIHIEQAKTCPLLSRVAMYHAPKLLTSPTLSRDVNGLVSIFSPEQGVNLYYTTDGSAPTHHSTLYSQPFTGEKVNIKAIAIDPSSGETGPIASVSYDLIKKDWQIIGNPQNHSAIDDDINTVYTVQIPSDLIIDLGKEYLITGATYIPDQSHWPKMPVTDYELYVSQDGKNWNSPVAYGEFSNIKNSPTERTLSCKEQKGRYLRLKMLKAADNVNEAGIAEFGVLTR